MVFLHHKGECQSSEKIAENICTHPARVRKILSKLKKAGLVQTKEGLAGGCAFEEDPGKVTLRSVCAAVAAKPVSVRWHSGDTDMTCLIASGMAAVMGDVYEQLNAICYEKLEEVTILDIDRKIFKT